MCVDFCSLEFPLSATVQSSSWCHFRRKLCCSETFPAFSNLKSILKKTNLFDIPARYPPYTTGKLKILKKIMH